MGNLQKIPFSQPLPDRLDGSLFTDDLCQRSSAHSSAGAHRLLKMSQCRYYENKYPEIDDVVVVNVRSIADMGAYVHLLEYNNIEGMILLSELSRRRIRSINKMVRVGKGEIVSVLRVDKDKGYIDLSKRRVNDEDRKKCENRYEKAKHVNSILRHVADTIGMESQEQLEELFEKTAWTLDREYKKEGSEYAASYDCFKRAVDEPLILEALDIAPETREVLLKTIRRRLTPQAVKVRADIEVSCYTYEGIDAIKAALRAGLECSTEQIPLNIQLIAPPLYVVTTSTTEHKIAIEKLREALDAIQKNIGAAGGLFAVKEAPKVVSDIDEVALQDEMRRLELQNAEVDGDEDSDEGGSGDEEGMPGPPPGDEEEDEE